MRLGAFIFLGEWNNGKSRTIGIFSIQLSCDMSFQIFLNLFPPPSATLTTIAHLFCCLPPTKNLNLNTKDFSSR